MQPTGKGLGVVLQEADTQSIKIKAEPIKSAENLKTQQARTIWCRYKQAQRSQSLNRTILDIHNDLLWYTLLKHRSGGFKVCIKIKSIKSFCQKDNAFKGLSNSQNTISLSKKQDIEFLKMPHVKFIWSQQNFIRTKMQQFMNLKLTEYLSRTIFSENDNWEGSRPRSII